MEFLDLILLGQHLGHGPGHVTNHGVLANMVATIVPCWNAWKNLRSSLLRRLYILNKMCYFSVITTHSVSNPSMNQILIGKKNHLIMFPLIKINTFLLFHNKTLHFDVVLWLLKNQVQGYLHVENYRMMKAPVWDTKFFSLDRCMYSVRYRAQWCSQ